MWLTPPSPFHPSVPPLYICFKCDATTGFGWASCSAPKKRKKSVADGAGAGRAAAGKRKRGADGVGLAAASGAAKKRKLKHVNIPKVWGCGDKCLTQAFDLGFFRYTRSVTTVEI